MRALVKCLFPVLGAASLCACVTLPVGPSVMVLPGTGKSFEEFQADDAMCRGWAAHSTGVAPQQAAASTAVGQAAVATAVGAVAGTAIGGAAGAVGHGAAIGAGSGLLLGTLTGASSGAYAGQQVQSRYDTAYMQCMYAKGNQIPVARGSMQGYVPYSSEPPAPMEMSARRLPPPPPGAPPPPPPDAD
jgi:hypothetical protein